MTTQVTSKKKPPLHWFAPRFSLRMLLLVVTVAAIGSAVWWRWPVMRTTTVRKDSYLYEETFTYHRGLWGNLIRHGVHRTTVDGEVKLEEHYREGLLHGPQRISRRELLVTGEYFLGEKHGTWKYESRPEPILHLLPATYDDPFGGPPIHKPASQTRTAAEIYRGVEHWNRGKRDGLFQWWNHSGKLSFSHEFKNDRLIAAQNSPSGGLLAQRVAAGVLNNQKLENALFAHIDLEYPKTPLREVIEDLRERIGLSFAMRWRRKTVVLPAPPEPAHEPPLPTMNEIPFSDDWILVEPEDLRAAPQLVDMRPRSLARPLPLPPVVTNIDVAPVSVSLKSVPLLAGFDAILSPLELVLDYRYGVLCIVDTEGAEDWQDATGVMDLHPPSGSLLESRLDSPAKPTCLEPLRDVLQNLAADQEIQVELRVPKNPIVVPHGEMVGLFREVVMIRDDPSTAPKEPLPITLRQLLGLLLDQANLHCREERGVLIIEPLKQNAGAQAEDALP